MGSKHYGSFQKKGRRVSVLQLVSASGRGANGGGSDFEVSTPVAAAANILEPNMDEKGDIEDDMQLFAYVSLSTEVNSRLSR